MSVEPATFDLEVFQGAYWSQTLLLKDSNDDPYDLSTYDARMQVRRTFEDATPEIELTNGNSRILLYDGVTPPEYNILLQIAAVDTAALDASVSDRRWRYDLELIPPGGAVRRLLQGKFKVSLEVTR